MSIQLRLFPPQNNFPSVQLTHYLFLSSPHWHQNTLYTKLADNAKLDVEHRTCTASQYTQLHEKQNWKNKKNFYRCQCCSSQRSLSPFWFQLLTIFPFFIGGDFYHRQLLVLRIVKIKITIVTPDHQLHKSCDSQIIGLGRGSWVWVMSWVKKSLPKRNKN